MSEIEKLAARASRSRRDMLHDRRQRHADPAAAPRPRRSCARTPPAPARSAPPAAASARPMRTRSAAAPSASRTCRPRARWSPKIERLLRPPQRAAPRARPAGGRPRAAAGRARRDRRRRSCPSSTAGLARCSIASGAAGKRILFEGAQGALLDVDHGTYPFVTSSNTVAARPRPARGMGPRRRRLCAGHRQGLHHPRRRGPVPDRADDEIGQHLGSGATSSAPSPAASAAAAGSTPCLVRQTVRGGRHRRHRAHQARRARRPRRR